MSFFTGLLAGCLGGLVGVGGGVIMIPFMVGVQKLTQHKAHGTSLVALVFTGIAGAVTYISNKSVDFTAAALIVVTAGFSARAGASFASALPEWQLKKSFGFFLLSVAAMLLMKPYLSGFVLSEGMYYRAAVLLISGILSGFLSGMMGVGGGAVMVPAMAVFGGMSQHISQGTSLLAMIPAGSIGAYTHWKRGNVAPGLLPGLISGIVIGTYAGGSFAHHLSEHALRAVFSLVLVWVGIKYLRTPRPQKI